MKGPILIGLVGIFLLLYGIWDLRNDIKKYRTIENFDLCILIFSVINPIIAIILGLFLTILFICIIAFH